MSDQKETCAKSIFRGHWPDPCRRNATVMGTFTHHESGKTFRLGLCGQHHRGLPDSGVFTTRNRKVQEDYPYLAIGTFKADEPA